MKPWYIEKGPDSDVILSSRIRLARNFNDYPFPMQMNKEDETKIVDQVRNAVSGMDGSTSKEFVYVDAPGLQTVEKQSLVEKHLISPDLAENTKRGGAFISRDERISIMVNEEDHLRIQCFLPGMQMNQAWKLCSKIDDLLEKKITYAFSENYGYLACCPTNIGTGLRASVMVHLPALAMTGYVGRVLEACGKLGIAVRGIYGENSETSGNMLQISNQVTLGLTEDEIISSLSGVAVQIMEQERTLRNELYKQNTYKLEDRIFRSLGVFSNARILSTEESLKLLSDVRLGVDMGIVKDINIETLNEIMLFIQPASLQKYLGRQLDASERDIKRAELIRSKLNGN